MYKCIAVSIFLLLNALNTYSQSNFRKGFIISNTNDTTQGFIDFRTDNMNSKLCRFKLDLNEQEQLFLPGEIYAYRFVDDGKFYVSKHVKINKTDHHVFLEFLVQGIKNLYFLPFENGYYFFENTDGSMLAITKLDDMLIDNFKIKPDLKYKGQLSYVFRDCMPIATNTQNALFDHKTMIDLTLKYHDKMCESGESCVLFENDYRQKYTKLAGTLYTGFEYNSIKHNFEYMPTMYSISPVLGTTLGFSSPRFYKPLWLEFDINLSKLSGASEYQTINPNEFYNYKFTAIKINYGIGLKYDFPINKLQFYVKASVGQTTLKQMESRLKHSYFTLSNEIITDTFENENLPNNRFSNSVFGFGIEKKLFGTSNVNLELSYYNSQIENKIKTLLFKIGYIF